LTCAVSRDLNAGLKVGLNFRLSKDLNCAMTFRLNAGIRDGFTSGVRWAVSCGLSRAVKYGLSCGLNSKTRGRMSVGLRCRMKAGMLSRVQCPDPVLSAHRADVRCGRPAAGGGAGCVLHGHLSAACAAMRGRPMAARRTRGMGRGFGCGMSRRSATGGRPGLDTTP
jgi:hypothetical protein